jgi:hypothetical protein
VTALKVASVGDLDLEISEGRDRRRIQNDLFGGRGFREGNEIFRRAESDEFFIFAPYRRAFTQADAKKKLKPILVQFIKFVLFGVVEVTFFEMF